MKRDITRLPQMIEAYEEDGSCCVQAEQRRWILLLLPVHDHFVQQHSVFLSIFG